MLAAFVSIPVLISSLGVDRFGVLTLIWAVVSYFGLFDLGLGRALTLHLAPMFASKLHSSISPLITTTLALMFGLGMIAGLIMAILTPWGVSLLNGIANQQEVIDSLYAMAFAMPAILMTSGLRGVLEANHSFGIVNILRLPMGLFTFLGPLVIVVFYEQRLDYIAWVLAFGRIVACFAHAWWVWRVLPDDSGPIVVDLRLLKPLYRTGGWMTVSNVISPFMGYIDRFLIGVIVSTVAVAYYVTPNELITKLWIIPGSITAVLFPQFASQMFSDHEKTLIDFKKSINLLFAVLLPITATLAIFSNELLSFWIDADFANHSANLLQIFAIGILVNSLAHVPFTLIQSFGQPRLVALVHSAELPVFILLLWWFTSTYGVIGAAIAWLIRMVIDSALMFYFTAELLNQPKWYFWNKSFLTMFLLSIFSFFGLFFQSIAIKVMWVLLILSISVFALVPWGLVLKARVLDNLD